MIKRALFAVAAILGICFSLPAQEMKSSNAIHPASLELYQVSPSEMVEGRVALGQAGSFGRLNSAWYGSGPLTLIDRQLFSFPRAFGWMEATPSDFLPNFIPEQLSMPAAIETPRRDSGNKTIDLLHKLDYVGGEVGVFYGRSTGKFSREVEQGYILGQVIDGNTQITVGGSYEHASGRGPKITGP